MSVKHEFTGVFIPAHIWLSNELIPAEKMMLGEITALSIKTGWCNAGRKHFAEWLGCELSGVTYYIKKLEALGFIEVKRESGANSKMRVVVSRFYPSVPLTGVVSPTDGGSQSPLLHKIQYKENNKALSQRIRENEALEAQPNIEPHGAGGPAALTIHDPELPGVKIVEPVTPPPPQRIELRDRPQANTPVELETRLRQFYVDWPEEWKTGILENGRGMKHPEGKRKEIVKDFCCWAIENGRGTDTFQQLNARLQAWFRNEQYADWKRQPAKQNNGATATYEPPKNAVY